VPPWHVAGQLHSSEYAEIPKVFFTPHHVGIDISRAIKVIMNAAKASNSTIVSKVIVAIM
jgi:hypothetical protein